MAFVNIDNQKNHKLGLCFSGGPFISFSAKYDNSFIFGFFAGTIQKNISVLYQYTNFGIKVEYSKKKYEDYINEAFYDPYFLYLEVDKHTIEISNWSFNLSYNLKYIYVITGMDFYNIQENMKDIGEDYFGKIKGTNQLNKTNGYHIGLGLKFPLKLNSFLVFEPYTGIIYYIINGKFEGLLKGKSFSLKNGFHGNIGMTLFIKF